MEVIFVLERIQQSELPTLLNLAKSTFINSYAHLNNPQNFNAYVAANFNLDKITIEFNNAESAFFFAKINEEICGYLKLNWGNAQTESQVSNAIEIERIYVKQAFQGQKVGKKMIEESVEFAKKQAKESVWLGVWERNPKAIGFYKKMGFKAFGEHVFWLGPEKQIDILMKKKI